MLRSLLTTARAAWTFATDGEALKHAVHRRYVRVQLERLRLRVQQLEFRMRDLEDRAAAGVDVDFDDGRPWW